MAQMQINSWENNIRQEISADHARQAALFDHMRYGLAISTALVIVTFTLISVGYY